MELKEKNRMDNEHPGECSCALGIPLVKLMKFCSLQDGLLYNAPFQRKTGFRIYLFFFTEHNLILKQ